jgi:type 1 glutamine amidotransferase
MMLRITIALLVAFLVAPLAAQDPAGEEGWTSLFNGKDLAGWDGNPAFWRVEDGAITGQTTPENPTKGNTFIIWRQGELDDFELKLEYKIVGGNSGIQYRSFEVPGSPWTVGGYQADFEAGDKYSGILYGERYRGILCLRGEKTVIGADHKPKKVGDVGDTKELQSKIRKEDWNEYHIIAKGHTLLHRINGHVTAECTDEDVEQRRRSGILALQLHTGPPMKVQFRNLRLKRLPLGDAKKVVFVSGKPSHGYGDHEHYGGCLLLAKGLNQSRLPVLGTVYKHGWPADPSAFDNADAVVIYCDGGGGHLANSRLELIDGLMKKGVGLGCIHYGVEVPKGPSGDKFLDWIGGYFETHWSVNPHWTAKFEKFPDHPVARGVQPFEINDEWYYHMRFREGMEGVTPILSAVPPDSTRDRKDGPHSGNPAVRAEIGKNTPEHVMWVRQRPDGGRGFGFTGGHRHWNWGNPNHRKVVLNAILWIAGGEVPEGGVPSADPTQEELEANLDKPKPQPKKQ